MSFHSVKIEDEFYEMAKKYAKPENRTISGQIAYWAKIGKISLENPDLPVPMIKDIILAQSLKEHAEPFQFRNE